MRLKRVTIEVEEWLRDLINENRQVLRKPGYRLQTQEEVIVSWAKKAGIKLKEKGNNE